MTRPVRWWRSLLARSLAAVIGLAVFVGALAGVMVGHVVEERVSARAMQRLNELLDTVESTASVACFTADEQLAREVALGLLRNSEVWRVAISAEGIEIARAGGVEMARPGKTGTGPAGSVIRRQIHSPFKENEIIGEVTLEVDHRVIALQVRDNVQFARLWLVISLALVVVAAAAAMLYLVVRPIKATSDRLHQLDTAGGGRLAVPEGHEGSELGRLVEDINQLTGHLDAALNQERALRVRREIDQRKYQNLFDNASSGIFVADRQGRLDSFNRAFAVLTWLPSRDGAAQGRYLAEAGWIDSAGLLALIGATLDAADSGGSSGREADFYLEGRRGDQRCLHVALISLGDGSVQGTVIDVTQRKREELSARRLAVTDSLTGLANREGLQRQFDALDTDAAPLALVRLNLEGYKPVMDAFGYLVGDRLVLEAVARIRSALNEKEFAARIGNDEFAVALIGPDDQEALAGRVESLIGCLTRPYDVQTLDGPRSMSIGASAGIALSPRNGNDIRQLLGAAELALDSARMAGGNNHRFYDASLRIAAEHRRRLEDDLRAAVAERQLQPAFQPIIDLRLGRLVGAEALLRWQHPERGFVSPEIFIPLAEEIGLIGGIGRLVLDSACQHLAVWRHEGFDIYVSVNVSARQIPADLPPELVLDILKQHGLPPSALVIEITEGILMSNIAMAQTWMESLRAAGIRVYLDDFGTGYSSLSYLKRFPLDTVKIDKSFIRDLRADKSDRALVDAIITMASSLELNVVAEGIEDRQQLILLRQMGCGYGQGYYFSRPVPAHEFIAAALRVNEIAQN